MSKTIVVFGATGNQGSSVVRNIQADPALKEWKIKAVTRDPTSEKAKALGDNVELVKADVNDNEALVEIQKGADATFIVTVSWLFDEKKCGKAMIDAAVTSGVPYIIFSTLPSTADATNGKVVVPQFDVKKEIEDYIRTLPVRSAFLSPSGFLTNFLGHPAYQIREEGDGTYYLPGAVSPGTRHPLVNIDKDFGKYVCKILKNPDEMSGKVFSVGSENPTMAEICEIISKGTGKTVKYKQIPNEEYEALLPAEMRKFVTTMFRWLERAGGFWGPNTDQLMKESNEGLKDLGSFDEFLKVHTII